MPRKSRAPNETILVDSREQKPYRWAIDQPVEKATLDVGDYSGKTVRDLLRIERKSLGDLLGCVGGGRARFERCLARLEAYPSRFLLIEASLEFLALGKWRDFHRGLPRGSRWNKYHPDLPPHGRALMREEMKITPGQVIGSVMAWSLRHGVAPLFCGDRRHGKAMVARLVHLAAEQRRKERASALGQE